MAGSPIAASAQRPAVPAAPLALDGVTVVDVEQGKLLPARRVVIVGNRIRAVGDARAVRIPAGARVIRARGKYLMPGLWDMHVHGQLAEGPAGYPAPFTAYSVLLTNGITGIRDAGTGIPLDTLRRWRREVLAGTRVGPPRQLVSGQAVTDTIVDCERGTRAGELYTCVTADAADQRRLVDSLKIAGIDMLKLRYITHAPTFFTMVREARRVGLPAGGWASAMTAAAASDSGATILDHLEQYAEPSFRTLCDGVGPSATVEKCAALAERFRRNGTWLVPTLRAKAGDDGHARIQTLSRYLRDHRFTFDSLRRGGWFRRFAGVERGGGQGADTSADSSGVMSIMQQAGLPVLAGTDVRYVPLGQGELHLELALFVLEGMTPLAALQTATLNPAVMLHATDSFGTVAPGKLADLLLLDANPLADITNTATIRAVVANGRYFDRRALDRLRAAADVEAKGRPWPPSD